MRKGINWQVRAHSRPFTRCLPSPRPFATPSFPFAETRADGLVRGNWSVWGAADVLSLAGGFTSSLAAEAGGLKYSRSRRGQRPKPATALQPVDYYSLPFCRPAVPADAHRGKPSFTSLLFGGQAQDAPFYFRMMVRLSVLKLRLLLFLPS